MKKMWLMGMALTIFLAGCDKVPGAANLPGVKQEQNKVTEASFANISDPLLKKHMVAQANQTEFRIRSVSSGRDAAITQVNEMELKGEDFNMSSWEEKNSTKANEMITMGDTTYLKDYKDNSWWKQTASKEELKENVADEVVKEPIDFKEMYEEAKDTVTYKNLGEEACGELTCYKYEQVDSASPEGKRLFWFDNKDFLLRKEQNGFGEFTATSEYSYDNINIKAPTPTKEVPAGKSIYEYMVYEGANLSGEQSEELNKAMEEVKKMQQDVGAGGQPETWQPEEVYTEEVPLE